MMQHMALVQLNYALDVISSPCKQSFNHQSVFGSHVVVPVVVTPNVLLVG